MSGRWFSAAFSILLSFVALDSCAFFKIIHDKWLHQDWDPVGPVVPNVDTLLVVMSEILQEWN